jgi:hypothetical protein
MWPPPQAAGELPAREAAANGPSTNSVIDNVLSAANSTGLAVFVTVMAFLLGTIATGCSIRRWSSRRCGKSERFVAHICVSSGGDRRHHDGDIIEMYLPPVRQNRFGWNEFPESP